MTLRTVLLSLQALLAAAEPDDPQDAVVANQVGHVWDWDFRVCHVLKKNHIHMHDIEEPREGSFML
jgi:ubiquitin-protein ligase